MDRFVWGTHLAVALLLTGTSSAAGLATWGVTGPWWDPGLAPAAAGLLVAWTVLVAIPAGWLEAWSLASGHRTVARAIAVAYLMPTWYVTHFPAGFRIIGDASPIDGHLLAFGWITFGILVVAQAGTSVRMRTLRFPSVDRGRGQRLARRLGLVE